MTGRVTESPYDAIADWYDAWVGPDALDDDAFFPTVRELMGDVAGQQICDLACGQGRVARYLADQGARVIGIDVSGKLLSIARRAELARPRGIAYLQADAQGLDALAPLLFDGVVCHMALMDIPDLVSTLKGIARVLRPGGWLVFSILHPCYNSAPSGELLVDGRTVRLVSGYFAEGYWRSDARTGPPGKVGSYHRTLSTYVNAFHDAGFFLQRLAEPRATGRHAERRAVWAEVPAVLVARCEKERENFR